MLPAANAIGNMTDFGAEHAAAAGNHFGFAERRMPEPEQVADLVDGDRLEVVPAGHAGGIGRPRKGGIEEDVGLDNLAGRRVDDEVGGAEDAIEVGTVLIAEHGHAVAGRSGWPA